MYRMYLTHIQVHVATTVLRVQNSSITPGRLPHAIFLLINLSPDFCPEDERTNTKDQAQAPFVVIVLFFSFPTP